MARKSLRGAAVRTGEEKPHIMGLRIVKQIVLAHKGVFEIQDKGRCVSMRFPAEIS